MIASAVGFLAVAMFSVVVYLYARSRADKGLLAKPPPVRWPVTFVAELLQARVELSLRNAIAIWNDRVPGAFVEKGGLARGTVVTVTVEPTKGYARLAWHSNDAETMRILVDPDSVDSRCTRALAHELGHLLGLDHDDDPASVMCYEMRDAVVWVSDKDVQLARKAVGK